MFRLLFCSYVTTPKLHDITKYQIQLNIVMLNIDSETIKYVNKVYFKKMNVTVNALTLVHSFLMHIIRLCVKYTHEKNECTTFPSVYGFL